ncbi:MAG: hypothetical protein ACFFB5_23165 [Promethearchaeota archaeon]
MKNRRIDLDRFDKAIIIIWACLIALLLGGIEAQAFVYYLDYELHNFPFYWMLYAFFIFLMLSIVPFLTREKTDWLLTIGGAFLIQFFQDIGHWLTKALFQGTWKFGDPVWTPLWDLFQIDFPIPLFWIIDWIIFGVFFIVWWVLDRYLAVAG